MGKLGLRVLAVIAALGATAAGASSVSPIVTWEAGNGHSYQVIKGRFNWDEARADAETRVYDGQVGYLATITEEAEWDFVVANLNRKKQDLFMGGSDAAEEGVWRWMTGPEAGTLLSDGYTNWNRNEPNNATRHGEDHLAGWSWGNNTGWNDVPYQHGRIKGYLVEYGDVVPAPLPAALPLLLAGIGGLVGLRRMRRRA